MNAITVIKTTAGRLHWLLAAMLLALPALAETLPAADGPGGLDAVKTWAAQRVNQAAGDFAATGGQRLPSPTSWADQFVYQIQVDRFNDGDPSLNGKNVTQWQFDHRYTDQRGLADYRHGGDLQGIIDRLDYLDDLGVTTLWITPVFQHDGSYHGYCTTDFTKIDPGFGSNEKLRELTAAAHQRGMKVVLDIVVNHMCSNDSGYDDGLTPFNDTHYSNCTNDLEAKHWSGTGAIRGQRRLNFGSSFFPPFRNQEFFSRCGYKSGDFSGHGPGAVWGDFSPRMFDLNTLNWDFQDIFTDLHKYWIAYADIDGFRLDAAKHVSADFIAKFSTDIRAYAASLGKTNFYIIGEVADSSFQMSLRGGRMRADVHNPANSSNIPLTLKNRLTGLRDTYLNHPVYKLPGLNGLYDFAHSGSAVDALRGYKTPLQLKQYFYQGAETDHSACSGGFCDLTANGDILLNWNLFELHDWPRFSVHNRDINQLRGALGYFATQMGIPVIYYGVEQGFDASCPLDRMSLTNTDARNEVYGVCASTDFFNHVRYRQDMFMTGPWRLGSMVPAINNLGHIGFDNQPAPASWQTDPMLARDHDLYKYVRKLTHIRNSCTALRQGWSFTRQAWSSSGGLMVFSRIKDNQEILVVQNMGATSKQLTSMMLDFNINRNRDNTTYRNLLNGFQRGRVGNLGSGKGLTFYTDSNGAQSALWIAGYQTMIFVHESETAPWDATLETHLCGAPGNAAPVADAGADLLVQAGTPVSFNGSASRDSDGSISSYSWTLPDGTPLTGPQPSHTFASVGVYTVTLTVTDNGGKTATDSVQVTVQADPVFSKVHKQLYLRGTHNNWGTTTPMQLVDHNTWQLEASFGSSSTERFKLDVKGDWTQAYGDTARDGVAEVGGADIGISQGAGSYRIRFNDVSNRYTVQKLTASNQAPLANAGADVTVAPGGTVSFNASASTDSDGSIVSYSWAVPGSSTPLTGATASWTFASEGVYSVTLTVTDNGGLSASDTLVVTVKQVDAGFARSYNQVYFRGTANGFGTAAMTLVADNSWQIDIQNAGLATDRFKFDINGDWKLNFGDTNKDGIAEQGGADIYLPQVAGSYRISFNDKTRAWSAVRLSNGGNVAPQAQAGADQTVLVNSVVTFDGSASVDSDGSVVSYSWSIPGVAAPLTGPRPSHTFTAAGSYNVTLTVTDNAGAQSNDVVVITVNPAAGFTKGYNQVYFRGTANGFGTDRPLTLVANNTWQIDIQNAGLATDRFKFDIHGDWKLNFGDTNKDGIADQTGADIYLPQVAGSYRITFNDQTRVYTVVKQ